MGSIDVSALGHTLADGRVLLEDVSFRVGDGDVCALVGANGAGRSHLLRLLAGEPVPHTGVARLGARVVPGLFAQTHQRPGWLDRTLVDLLWEGTDDRPGVDRGRAMGALRRYGLQQRADQTFSSFDRFLIFGADGRVVPSDSAVFDGARVARR